MPRKFADRPETALGRSVALRECPRNPTLTHAGRKRAAKGEQLRAAGRERETGNGSESAGNPRRSGIDGETCGNDRQAAVADVSPAVSLFAVQQVSGPPLRRRPIFEMHYALAGPYSKDNLMTIKRVTPIIKVTDIRSALDFYCSFSDSSY